MIQFVAANNAKKKKKRNTCVSVHMYTRARIYAYRLLLPTMTSALSKQYKLYLQPIFIYAGFDETFVRAFSESITVFPSPGLN